MTTYEPWLKDERDSYRDLYRTTSIWVDHLVANDGLHSKGGCHVCDLIRVRPTKVVSNTDKSSD